MVGPAAGIEFSPKERRCRPAASFVHHLEPHYAGAPLDRADEVVSLGGLRQWRQVEEDREDRVDGKGGVT